MIQRTTGKRLEYVFNSERDKDKPLTFFYTKPDASMMANYRNAMVSGNYSQNGDEKVRVTTAITTGTAKLSLVADCVTGWSGYGDDKGNPVAYSRDELMRFDPDLMDEFMAHLDSLLFVGKLETKNYKRPSEAGSPGVPSGSSQEQPGS